MGLRMDGLFARYGCRAKLNSTWVQVLFQPPYKAIQQVFVPLGTVPQGQYVCYFPAGCAANTGDSLELLGHAYEICQTELVRGMRGKPLYRRAFCRQKGGEAL